MVHNFLPMASPHSPSSGTSNMSLQVPPIHKAMVWLNKLCRQSKISLKKTLQDGEDPYLALLNFRTSPTVDGGPSPAFKLMQRNSRTLLPSAKPYRVKAPNYSSAYSNQGAKSPPSLSAHDTVRIHNGTSWATKGKVIEPLEYPPRSYTV